VAAALAAATAVVAPAAAPAASLHVLVTNDDGVRAEGIDTLARGLLRRAGVRVTIVAPATNQSGTADRMTRGRLRAFRTRTRSGLPAVAVRGTPAAAVRYALRRHRPDLVMSGINDGANLGPIATEVSGTVGAARYAARRGLPAVVTSQGRRTRGGTEFGAALRMTMRWFDAHRDALRPGTVTNINTPSCSRGGPRGLLRTVLATTLPPGVRRFRSVDCTRPSDRPRDDVSAFLAGWATVTGVPLR